MKVKVVNLVQIMEETTIVVKVLLVAIGMMLSELCLDIVDVAVS